MASLLMFFHSVPTFQYLIILWLLIQIPPYLSSNDNYTSCAIPYNCGGIKIGFPFWGQNRPKWCGHPLLQLHCDDDQTFITIKDVTYKVFDANPDYKTMRIARVDYFQGLCPSKLVNTSLNTELLVFGSDYKNLTLFYNCHASNGYNPFGSTPGFFNCFSNGTSDHYFYAQFWGLGSPPMICTTSVVVPLTQYDIGDWTKIQGAIEYGFLVKWIVGIEECVVCQKSGGACGYDWNSNQTCYCRDQSSFPGFKPCPPSSPNARAPPSQDDDAFPPSGSSSRRWNWKITTGVACLVASAAACGVVVILGVITYCNRNKYFSLAQGRLVFKKKGTYANHNVEDFINNHDLLAPKRYSYSEVKRITNSFRDKLGQGGYGVVYKGSLPDGRSVAVKVISESKGSGEEFINEVASISRTSHVNIVSLFGFCNEMDKRALIYEFMPNGSLDKFIYNQGSPNTICDLDWNTLYQITISIARGLEYLHRGCSTRILHLDIKPQNILLDDDFCPKIADFGLAKICKMKESIVSILGTRGTPGYIAPEVFSRTFGGVSHKSDVYSYGMLILEVVGGRKNYDNGRSNTSELYFPDWIYKDLEQGNIPTTCLVDTKEENDMVMKITLVSMWCIQLKPSDRPSMSKVVEMLEGPLQSITYPPKPVLNSPEKPLLQYLDISYDSSIHETDSIALPVENISIK